MTKRAFKVMRFSNAKPFLYPGIAFAILVIALKFIDRHYFSTLSICTDSIWLFIIRLISAWLINPAAALSE
jgi:hypothetical protein